MAATITAKQLAQSCDTDPKTFRRFLREHLRGQDIETPGQGGRYAFTKKEAKGIITAFSEWHAPKVKAPKVSDEVDDIDDEDENADLVAELEAAIAAAEGTSSDEDEDDDVEDEVEEDEDEDVEPEVEDLLDIEEDDVEDLDSLKL